jgi:hypothetical protein
MSANTITCRSRLIPSLAAVLSAVAILPGAASASTTWFGSSLNHDPANAGSLCSDLNVGPNDVCTHVGSYYPGFSGRAGSPISGTIVALKLRPEGPMTFVAKVVTVHNLSSDEQSGQAAATAQSRQISVQGPTQNELDNGVYPTVTVNVHLRVKRGQELAIDTNSNTAEYCSDGTPGQLVFDPVLAVGQGFSNSSGVDNCLMLIQAIVRH